MADTLWHLKRCDLFQQLSPEEFAQLERCSRFRTFPARSPIYLPGEKAESVFLIAEGVVKVSTISIEGKESILAFIEQGELFGELALLDYNKREDYVEAVERTTVVMMPATAIQEILASRPDVTFEITKLVGLRRVRIERRIRTLMFQSARERLIHLLLDLNEQFGIDTPEGVRLRLKLSHQDLGNLIGATRETVTSLLCQLRAEGCIEHKRCKVVLKNVTRLAKSVQRLPEAKLVNGTITSASRQFRTLTAI